MSKPTSGSGNSSVILDCSSNTAQSMAAEALRNTINIPPTFYKIKVSESVSFIVRDIDFSRAYHLQVNR